MGPNTFVQQKSFFLIFFFWKKFLFLLFTARTLAGGSMCVHGLLFYDISSLSLLVVFFHVGSEPKKNTTAQPAAMNGDIELCGFIISSHDDPFQSRTKAKREISRAFCCR